MTADTHAMRIGFLQVKEVTSKIYRVGLLITNEKTHPLEFLVTDRIVVTKIQSILYHEQLLEYIYSEVMLNHFFGDSRTVDVLFVTAREALNVRPLLTFPVCLLMPPKQTSGSGNGESTKPFLFTHRDFSQERAGCVEVLRTIVKAITRENMFEPFERVNQAILYFDGEKHD